MLRQLKIFFGPVRKIDGFDVWMDYEVAVHASLGWRVYIFWQPLRRAMHEYSEERKAPIVFAGVTLGGRVENYPFLKEISREGPDLVHYRSDLPPLLGVGPYIFSAYKGVIYRLEFSNLNLGAYEDLLDLYPSETKNVEFWGDVKQEGDTFQLTPLGWDVNRCRRAYYRNVKPD